MTNIINIKETDLYKEIVDDTNIYNAIYSLESYVFEKGLLSEEDLDLYNQLSDKYNESLIKEVIKDCKKLIEEMLNSEDELFTIQPYFRMKDYKNNVVGFRPMHTANLKTQICLVWDCLLKCVSCFNLG